MVLEYPLQEDAPMHWRATSPMDQRFPFVVEAERGFHPFSELCRRFGVSRPTGYMPRTLVTRVGEPPWDVPIDVKWEQPRCPGSCGAYGRGLARFTASGIG